MQQSWRDQEEWLETDGLGGFASGTVGGIRTRRYHGLLTVAVTPPTGRFALVNGVEVMAHTPAGSFPLSSQRYVGQVVHPEGSALSNRLILIRGRRGDSACRMGRSSSRRFSASMASRWCVCRGDW